MTMGYPDSVYSQVQANPTDTLDAANHTQRHNDVITELIAIENYLGPSTGAADTSVRAQLAALKSQTQGMRSVVLTTSGSTPTASFDSATGVLSLYVPSSSSLPASPTFTKVTASELSVGTTGGAKIGISGGGITDHTGAAAINVSSTAIGMTKPTTFSNAPLITAAGSATNAAATLAQVDAKIAALRTELNAAILSKSAMPAPVSLYQNYVSGTGDAGATISSTVEVEFGTANATMANATGRDLLVQVTGCAWLKTLANTGAYFEPHTTSSGIVVYGEDSLGRVDEYEYSSVYSSFIAKIPIGKTMVVRPRCWKSGTGSAYLSRFNIQIIPVGFL